jgi:hypothetical protein
MVNGYRLHMAAKGISMLDLGSWPILDFKIKLCQSVNSNASIWRYCLQTYEKLVLRGLFE